jgi:hypothetical protein
MVSKDSALHNFSLDVCIFLMRIGLRRTKNKQKQDVGGRRATLSNNP